MKKLFLSLVAIVCATVSFAQNTLVATLSHGNDISMYYGTYALRDAMNAASSGDVINLSGGAFQAVNITKGITFRGTGIDDNTPTYIIGNYTINIPIEDANRFSMEGIRCSGTITMSGTFDSPLFLRSEFYSFKYNSGTTIKNAMFINCKISNEYQLKGASTVQFLNSFITCFNNEYEASSGASFINCVLLPYFRVEMTPTFFNSQLLNCILAQDIRNYNIEAQLPSTSTATNCVAIGYTTYFNSQTGSTGNKTVDYRACSEVFKTFNGKFNSYSESETFELTDEAKVTYLGTDGTEVGMYGGILPYDSTPSYPQITKMNVAKKTTADGKLSVEIEVSAAE